MSTKKSAQTKKQRHPPAHPEANPQKSSLTRRRLVIWSALALLAGAGIFGAARFAAKDDAGFDVTRECVTHGQLGMHIHPQLSILVNGGHIAIPANIGITADCMRPVHTHDASSQLHVEWTSKRDFTLGDFFRVWDKTFSKNQIFDYKANDTHAVTLTVNGVPSQEFEKLVLRDNDRIVIEYKRR
jgi:hypothetical protein